jgi:DNA-binding transcriptional LysR family regulator
VLGGIGIGMFSKASLVGELQHSAIVPVLDRYMNEARDVSLIWPRRRFVPARMRLITDFFVTMLSQRV